MVSTTTEHLNFAKKKKNCVTHMIESLIVMSVVVFFVCCPGLAIVLDKYETQLVSTKMTV